MFPPARCSIGRQDRPTFGPDRDPLQHHKAVWSDDKLPAPSGYQKRRRDGAVTHKSPFPTSLLHLMFHLVSLWRLRWESPPMYASPEWVTTTYDHTHWRTRDPVCSPIDKPVRAELVVGSVTTSESSVLYVVFCLSSYFCRPLQTWSSAPEFHVEKRCSFRPNIHQTPAEPTDTPSAVCPKYAHDRSFRCLVCQRVRR